MPRANPAWSASWPRQTKSTSCSRLPAATSSRHDAILKAFHQRLLKAGKKPMVALTAAMRKLVVLLNRLLKNPKLKLQASASAQA